jgi:hypothetical protein
MNSTNRGLNRFFIVVVALILIAVGAAVAAVGLFSHIRSGWKALAPDVQRGIDDAYAASPLLSTGTSWIGVGVIALLALIVVAMIVFIVKQGNGRTRRLIREERTAHGVTIVDAAVAEDILKDALADRPELVGATVTTFDVRGTPTLNVSVTARRGVSPQQISAQIEAAVRALDAVLGREIPVIVQIGGGFRARTSAATRIQ